MRSLFFKIFAILWISQSLIFVISTSLIIRRHLVGPDTLAAALDANLGNIAAIALQAYDQGGCPAFKESSSQQISAGSFLLDLHGKQVCQSKNTELPLHLAHPFPDRILGLKGGGNYVWLIPVVSKSGTHLEYVWVQPPVPQRMQQHPGTFLHFAFPQLPVAIAIGGFTTFVLVLLFSRPLVRLRRAARELAQGNLSARVVTSSVGSRPDEFQGLVQDFNHMAERLEALVGAQQILLRDVSHELRSPLARLSVALELAREDSDQQLAAPLERIEREALRLNQLIGELLTLSSLTLQTDVCSFTPVILNRVCEALLPDAEYEAQWRPCSVIFDQTSECTVNGDWKLLHRAVENVVRNAIRYTDPGTQVRLSLRRDDRIGMVTLEVEDRGPGIPEEELPHIFRPFYRVDRSRTSSTGGTGVGLAITDRSVRLHGGTVQAFAREGGGTRICMVFPAA